MPSLGAILLLLLVPGLAIGAADETCVCVANCGSVAQECCSCELRPDDDKCIFDRKSLWCVEGAVCGDDGACVDAQVIDSSERGCGTVGERCCERGWCESASLACASGTCVDLDGVQDSSPCCFEGAPCFGYYGDCDEDLLCVDGTCTAPA